MNAKAATKVIALTIVLGCENFPVNKDEFSNTEQTPSFQILKKKLAATSRSGRFMKLAVARAGSVPLPEPAGKCRALPVSQHYLPVRMKRPWQPER